MNEQIRIFGGEIDTENQRESLVMKKTEMKHSIWNKFHWMGFRKLDTAEERQLEDKLITIIKLKHREKEKIAKV